MALWSSQPRKSVPIGRNEEELAEKYFFLEPEVCIFLFIFLGKGTVIETCLCNLLFYFSNYIECQRMNQTLQENSASLDP